MTESFDHWGRPAFRVRKIIFATLWADEQRVVLRLTVGDQAALMALNPEVFSPVSGAWGARGWMNVQLEHVERDVFEDAILTAWQGVAPKRITATFKLVR